MKEMEKILGQALKRLLKIPYTTPTKGLFNEFGLRSAENEIIYRKHMFFHKLATGTHLSSKVFNEQLKLPEQTWASSTLEEITTMEFEDDMEIIKDYSSPGSRVDFVDIFL